ncbi:MAG: ElyC/SanA/YdcF family protein [Clostridiales bacterium]|nr:ElyC/SanA/YdcF family protein [Clostridiales bacterium]
MKRVIINIILALASLGILCLAILISVNNRVLLSAAGRILTVEEAAGLDADCILVLGAGVRDGRPSLMLADRLDRGMQLYFAGASEKLLMSGDHGREDYDEVNVMKEQAVAAGAESSDVFMDHAGFSTYESIYRARDVFRAERIIIVTQPYHLPRALYIAEALGLEAWGVAAEGEDYFGQSYRNAREVLARVKDVLYCAFQPEPTYLGEAIPVWGDGNATNDR